MLNLQASVIIPTLNRKKYLLQTLGFLEKQNFDDFEVIIVDQSDEDLKLKKELKILMKMISKKLQKSV